MPRFFSSRSLLLLFLIVESCPAQAQRNAADNAALKYWPALVAIPDEARRGDGWTAVMSDPYHAPIQDVRKLVNEWDSPFIMELARSGAEMPYCEWGATPIGPSIPMYSLNPMGALLTLLFSDSRIKLDDGKVDEAMGDLIVAISITRHLERDGLFPSSAIAAKYRAIAFNFLAHELPSLADPSLRRLKEKLASMPPPVRGSDFVRAQARFYVSWLRALSTPTQLKNALDELGETPDAPLPQEVHQAFSSSDKLLPLIEQLERFYEGLAKTMDQPMQEFLRRYDDLFNEQGKGVQTVAARLTPKAVLKQIITRWHDEKLRLAALECAIELEAGSSASELVAVVDGSKVRFELKREENGFLLVARIENDPTVSSFSFGQLALPTPITQRQLQYSDEDGEMLLKAAMLKARAENKFILVSFGANWCHPCLELTMRLLNDPKVAPVARDHFVIVKVNIGNHDKNAVTCHRFQLELSNLAVPRVLILDTNANVLAGGAGQQRLFEDTGDSDKILAKLKQLIATMRGRTEASGEQR